MKLILSDKSELEIQQYEYLAHGDDEGGVKIGITGITIDDLIEKLKNKLDEVSIVTGGRLAAGEITAEKIVDGSLDEPKGETVYQLKNAKLGNLIAKDTDTGIVTFTIKPQSSDYYIAQNKEDIEAINEAIADLAASVGGE